MSHQKIDELFKERLSGLEQAPSSEAWNKLEGMLANKKKKVIYFRLRAAAAIVLLLLSGWIIWSSQRGIAGQESIPLAEVKPLIDSASIQNIAQNDSNKEQVNKKFDENVSSEKPGHEKKPNINEPLSSNLEQLAEKKEYSQQTLDTAILVNTAKILLAEHTQKDEVLMKQVNETLPPVMIIYKQSPTEAIVQAPEATNEKVTWDAVVAVAKDFKEGNLNLTSRLKEAKEDLFSLRFTNKNKDNSK